MSDPSNLAALERGAPTKGRRKSAFRSLFILFAFLIGSSAVFLLIFRDKLRPRIPVTIGTVLLLESDDAGATGTSSTPRSIAQASGWIEADPFAIQVPAKTDGFLEMIEVLEGDAVQAGDVIARLDPADHQIEVELLRRSVDEAKSHEAVVAARQEVQRFAVLAAEAGIREIKSDLDKARDHLQRINTLKPQDRSESERIAATQEVDQLAAAHRRAKAHMNTEQAKQIQLTAEEDQARAQTGSARAKLELAQLQLERTRILAPTDGVILKRFREPGELVRGDAIVSLFQPDQLQVRVDVPLSDISAIHPGQSASISTAAFPGKRFEGTVTSIVGEADIARNTLQAKVAFSEPDPRLRPEMLCRVEFLGSATRQASTSGRQLWVPAAALQNAGEGRATVWVLNPVSQTIHARAVDVGATEVEGLVPVYSELTAGAKVVLNPEADLAEGARASVKGEL